MVFCTGVLIGDTIHEEKNIVKIPNGWEADYTEQKSI